MEGVGGAGLEVIFLVPDPRFIVLGMDKQGTDAGNVGGSGRAYRVRKRSSGSFPQSKASLSCAGLSFSTGEYPWAPGVTQARFLFL